MDERRAESRMLCADMVDICWSDASGHQQRSTVLLEDISAHGACLQVDRALPLGIDLTIEHPKAHMKACVRYCVYQEIGFFVGVELAPESAWSQKKFTPQHLLDLEKLVLRSAKKASTRGNKD